ncbi:MAG TPA: hypothetical protein VFM51_07240 [Solirubrobacterales bacterium]|nr:hypothetical protein [Solirubrobacterales bacterium]
MLPVGSLISDAATGAGFIAASIAIGGFLMQAYPALGKRSDGAVRAATAVGGLIGLIIAIAVIAAGVW